jgi:membrane fusion protein
MLVQQKSSYAAALAHSDDVLNQATRGLQEMKQNMDSYRRFQRQGLINRDQLSQQASLYYQQQNDLLTLSTQRQQNALQVLALEGEIHTRAADFDNDIFRLEMQRSELIRQDSADDAAGALVVTSPVSGRIDTSGPSSGQAVSPGDALALIIPEGAVRWELVMWVPDNAVPFIRPGAPVSIRYNAFPTERFGQFPGRITQIATAPATQQERTAWSSAPPAGAAGNWYRLTVTPDVSHFSWQGRRLRPGNGLRAECTLFLEKRRLWQWVLAPLYEMRDSTQGAVHGQ